MSDEAQAEGRPISVLIADDQDLIRVGFSMLLTTQPGIEVVGEAADGRRAVEMARALTPDVILMDIRMPVMDGIEATRHIVEDRPEARVLVLTTFDLDEYAFAAIRAGASGFLLKDVRPDELARAIRAVAAGDAVVSPRITRRMLEIAAPLLGAGAPGDAASAAAGSASATGNVRGAVGRDRAQEIREALTPRELDVFDALTEGLSNAEIAERLVLSEATVKSYMTSVLTKLGLRDRVQAVVLAYETGYVNPTRPRS
ncbi:MAG: response regulator transcription factor [Bifidobacteriaceae bacterium]|nr:response regulator transcription factor [Bifidobacteriaceae bacterium]